MQATNKKYTKKQLLDSFKKKQNEKIRELIIQETGVDLFSELPQEAVNKQQDQISLDLNDGFYRPKKTFTNSKNNNFRNDNNAKNNGGYNDFKRVPLNSRNLDGGDNQKFGRKKENSQPQVQQVKEMIPVFQECGFVQDSTIEVWYYKETEEIEGPFTSVDMDNMLFANKISFDTKVAFKDPEEKYVRIKKLITITYQDKYNHLFVEPKPVVANNDENNQRRGYFKKEFNNSNDNNNTNFSRGVPRFTKQPSDNQNTSGRPQFTRSISDAKQQSTEAPQVAAETNQKEEKQVPSQPVEVPKETKAIVDTKAVKSTKENTKKEVQQTSEVQPAPSQKKEEKKENKTAVVQEVKETTSITLKPEDLEGFQTVTKKSGVNKKFNKKNATKIVVVGQTEQELLQEENNRRLEEIRQRDLIQQQQYAEYQKQQQKKQEVPQKKIDYFDEEEHVTQIIEQPEYFPTLGDASTTKKTNKQAPKKENKKQVESSDVESEEEQQKPQKTAPIATSKAGNKLVKASSKQAPTNEKQQQQQQDSKVDPDWIVTDKSNKKKGKRTQEDSDEEYERQQQIINEQSRLEKLRKQREQEEKQRILEQQQEEKRRIEEFQRRQQFNQEEYHSESEEDVDPTDEKSFPTLGGAVYNGPPKNTIHNQQKKARGKTNTSYQSKALYNYVKTLEDDSWDVQPKSQPKQTQSKPKQNKISNEDFPSL